MFSSYRNIVLAVALALGVGFSVGFYTKGRFVKADQLEVVTEAQHQTAVDIQESLKTSLAVEQKVTTSDQQMTTIRKEVARRTQPKETTNEANLHAPVCDWRLDVGTVRLLNAARDGSALDTASLVDGAGKAPSEVGLPDLLDNDLEVVQLYRELAVRHDSLVDYVESKLKEQADK